MVWIVFAIMLFVAGSKRVARHDAALSLIRCLTDPPDSEKSETPRSGTAGGLSLARAGFWTAGAAAVTALRTFTVQDAPTETVVFAVLGVILGEWTWRRRSVSKQRTRLRSMEFHLPMVMEQIVMAVGSGLDILPAIREASSLRRDPISELLLRVVQLCENGITLEEALRAVSDSNTCPSVKHAFLHIALAHKEGGEVVRPLRELSDATQIYYQETVEEEIARLPVKAVLPLVLTFTGLIICFITVPLIQVGSITAKVSHVAGQK